MEESPALTRPEMNILEALIMLDEKTSIRRRTWPEHEIAYLKDGLLYIIRDGKEHQWVIGDGDYLANDWTIN